MEVKPIEGTNPLAFMKPETNFDAQESFRKQSLGLVKGDIKNKVDRTRVEFSENVKNSLYNSNQNPLSSLDNKKLAFNKFDIDVKEAYKPLTTGELVPMFDNVIGGTNNEERFAQQQSTGDKWLNAIPKFLGKTSTAILGGTVGTVNGIIQLTKTGDFSSTYDNDFNNWLDDLDTKLNYKLPNYYTEQEKNNSFLQNMGTANFWANDVLGGLSFTVGAVVSEGIWAWATGGTSLAITAARQGARISKLFGKGAQTAAAINRANSVNRGLVRGIANAELPTSLATRFGKAGELANTARFVYTSAGFESGVEARHYLREAEQEFISTFEEKNGRAIRSEDMAEFKNNSTKSANALFGFNMAIVGSSNLAVFGKMLDIKSPLNLPKKWANETLFGIGVRKTASGASEALKASKIQNIIAKSYAIGKTPVIEGFWEEGMQASGSNTAKNWIEASYDPKQMKNTMDLGLSFVEGIAETYGSKEGWKEIGIGMIVGLLSGSGVNLASKQGLFGELKQARKNAENEATSKNNYSTEKLLDRIATANRVSYFNEQAEISEEKGDITGAEISRASAMLAHINSAYNFDYTKEALEDVQLAVNSMDDATLMKQYGLETQEEVQQVKETLVSDYKKLSDEYSKQREFVDYMINDKSTEFGNVSTIKEIKEAVAYELTLGSKSFEFKKELLGDIQSTLAKAYNTKGESISNALKVQDILWSASKEIRRDFINKRKELIQTKKRRDSLEKERLSLEKSKNSKEDNKQDLNRLNSVVVDIESITTEIGNLEVELEGVLSAAQLQNPYDTEDQSFITTQDLENIETDLGYVSNLVKEFKKVNPREGYRLEGLIKEYEKSKVAFIRYADLSRQLTDPTLGLRGKRNVISELSSSKEPSKATLEFIQGMSENMSRIKQEEADRAVESTEEFRALKAKMTVPTKEDKKVSTIQDIIDANPYLFEYTGTADNASIPTKDEIAEYKSLLSRVKRSKKIDNTKATQNKPDYYSKKGVTTLSKAEMIRFQELNQKMSDWRFYESAVNDENISIANLIEQEDSRNQEVEQEVIQDELTVDDYVQVSTPEDVTSNGQPVRRSSIIQTYENVKVQVMNGYYYFSHLKLNSLVSKIKGDFTIVIKKPKTFDENGYVTSWGKPQEIEIDEMLDNQNVYGTSFIIKTEAGEIPVMIATQGRIQIPFSTFNSVKGGLGFDVFKQASTKTTYFDLYEENEEGEFVQKDSDFVIEQSLGTNYIEYTPAEVLELEPGTDTFFQVNMRDTYNEELREKYLNGEITFEEVLNKVKIYNVATNGKILGDLKANEEIVDSSSNFLDIRRMGADLLVGETVKQDLITIPYTAKVDYVLIGVPNISMQKAEEDGLVPKSLELTDVALEQIVDYGYIENGTLVLKNNTQEVRKDFISKLSKKSNVPIIIFRQGKYLVAYPVSLVKTQVDKSVDVKKVLNSKLNNSEKARVINDLLAQNRMSPNVYYNTEDNQNMFSSDGSLSDVMQKNLDELATKTEFANVKDWVAASHNKEALKDEISLTIDLEQKVIKSPKVIIDFDGAQRNDDSTPWYDNYVSTGNVTDEKINEIANKVVESGIGNSVQSNYLDKVGQINSENSKLIAEKKSLTAEMKYTANTSIRYSEINDRLNEISPVITENYTRIEALNSNPSLASVRAEDVFSRQELDVYNKERDRIKDAIKEIIKINAAKQAQSSTTQNQNC